VVTGVTVIAEGNDDVPAGFTALNRSSDGILVCFQHLHSRRFILALAGRSGNLNQGSGGVKLLLCLQKQQRDLVGASL
jgi:hypothetical protein